MPLPGKDKKIIKSLRVISKVKLTKHSCLVSCFLKQLRERYLCGVKGKDIIDFAVDMTELTCQNGCSRWSTNRVCHTRIREEHPLFCYPIYMWCFE